MIYTFSSPDEKGEVVLDGYVQVEPDGEAANVVQTVGIAKPQEKFETYLKANIYGQSFPHIELMLGEVDGEFSEDNLSHWKILPQIFRVSSGYGGVEEFGNEEFQKMVEDAGATD